MWSWNWHDALARHLEAHDALAALGLEAGPLRRRLGHPLPAVDERAFLLLGRFALGLQLLRRGVVVVGQPLVEQLLHGGLVAVQLLRLVVRAVRAADLRALVPVEAEPAEAVEDRLQAPRPRCAAGRCRRCAG